MCGSLVLSNPVTFYKNTNLHTIFFKISTATYTIKQSSYYGLLRNLFAAIGIVQFCRYIHTVNLLCIINITNMPEIIICPKLHSKNKLMKVTTKCSDVTTNVCHYTHYFCVVTFTSNFVVMVTTKVVNITT